MLSESVSRADIIKLNEDELQRISEILGGTAHDPQTSARWLLKKYHLKMVCVTCGAKGSLLVTPDAMDNHPGCPVTVADTVGSGDAFHGRAWSTNILRHAPLRTMNEAANRLGSWVASQAGATPPADPAVILAIHNLGAAEEA